MKFILLMFIGAIITFGEANAGYDCYDGKHDDCTAKWSRDHAPHGKKITACQKMPCDDGDSTVVEMPEQSNNCFVNGRAPQWALDVLKRRGHGAADGVNGAELTLNDHIWKEAICNKRKKSVIWNF